MIVMGIAIVVETALAQMKVIEILMVQLAAVFMVIQSFISFGSIVSKSRNQAGKTLHY